MSKSLGVLGSGIAALALAIGAGAANGTAVASPAPQAAAKAGSLPKSCMATIGETQVQSYFYANKVSKWAPVALPKEGARFTEFQSPLDDELNHYLAVTSTGAVYDSLMGLGGLGDGWRLDGLAEGFKPAGQTIPGIVDLEVGFEEMGEYARRPSKWAYALTGDGRLHALPMTYAKGSPRLGTPITLTAKGLSGLRGIEQAGRYWNKTKVIKHVLFGHTADGRLVELTIDVSKARPSLSYRVIAKGWQNVNTLAVGWCDDKPYSSHILLVAIDSAKRVTARLDPVWNDASLKGAKTIQLAPWKRGPANTLF